MYKYKYVYIDRYKYIKYILYTYVCTCMYGKGVMAIRKAIQKTIVRKLW